MNTFQKQTSIGILIKKCSENMEQIYRRTPCRSVISIKLLYNFIEIPLRHGASQVDFLHIVKTPSYKSIYRGLLLTLRVLAVYMYYIYVYVCVCIYIYICMYANFECLFYKCQIYINYSKRHFLKNQFLSSFLDILVCNRLLQTKSVKKYILPE